MKIVVYRNEGNLGNTIQTLGLTHIISPSKGVWYDNINADSVGNKTLIINGYFGIDHPIVKHCNHIFAGIHICGDMKLFANMQHSVFNVMQTSKYPILPVT